MQLKVRGCGTPRQIVADVGYVLGHAVHLR